MAGDDHLRATSLMGRTLKDKWRLESQLGSGGMASVWAARHRNGKRVAIKLLHPEFTRDESVRRRFLREGYVANKVKHKSVVTILDDDDDGELVFLVMELLEGETLNERWRRHDRRLGLRYVLRVADEVLDVLAAAHEQAIVHRDIKPANLFATTADELKVLDFGIAKLHEGPGGTGHTTRLGATLGSPSFMSPEQARARWEFVDARTDLWALGAVMFALLSGKNVHEAKTSNEMLIATATQTPRSLREAWPEVPDVVAAIVDRALAFERSDRWQDARAMQTGVRRALQIDFDHPRAPLVSLVDASIVAPPPSQVLATEMAFVGADPTEEASEPTVGPGAMFDTAVPLARRRARAPDEASPLMQTQATGLMRTIQRTPLASSPATVQMSGTGPPTGPPPPPSAPLSNAPPSMAPPSSASLSSAPPSSAPVSSAPLSVPPWSALPPSMPSWSTPPPSAPRFGAPPAGDSTTSRPVTAPAELAFPTIRAPPQQRSLRPTVVLGMFIAGGLVAGGIAFGVIVRRAPVAVVPAPITAAPSATPADTASAAASSVPPEGASAAAPTDSAAPADAPDASDSAAPAPSASADAGASKKKPPVKQRQRPPPKGSGKFLQRRP